MSLHDRPTLGELLAAVRAYLVDEIAATTKDRRARFRALIAANVLEIAERELASAPADEAAEDFALRQLGYEHGSTAERRHLLCSQIRAGRYDEAARFKSASEYARAMTLRKLAVSNPRFRTD